MSFNFNSAEAVNSPAPENTPAPEAQAQSPESVQSDNQANDKSASVEQSILDLTSTERFKFQDRVWTPKELQSAIMMQSDYTKKTQALAEERRYSSNLPVDLRSIAENPQLLDEFKKIYPQQYWATAEAVANRGQTQSQSSPQQTTQPASIPPELQSRIDRLEKDYEERNRKAIDSELDATFTKYKSKFPYADDEKVIAWAQGLSNKGVEVTDDVWTKIFEKAHKDAIELSDKIYAAKVKEQKTSSAKAFAGSPGGATPSPAPKLPKSIAEATKMLRESGELEREING